MAETLYYLYPVALLITLFLFILSKIAEDKWFTMFAGFIPLFLAIYIKNNGFYGFSDILVNSAALLTLFGIGAYLLIRSSFDLITEAFG